jgi:hypothetical protein
VELHVLFGHDEGVATNATGTAFAGGAVAGECWQGGKGLTGDGDLWVKVPNLSFSLHADDGVNLM